MTVRARRTGVLALVLAVGAGALAGATAPAAVPVDAISGVLEAFGTHALVALAEPHGRRQQQAFLVSLVGHPRFAPVVDDVVVTVGNSRYQAVVDRFVAGEDVPYEALRQAWRDTLSPNNSGEHPTHEELWRAVRAANARQPRERKLRVVLAEPPVDWDAVRDPATYRRWFDLRVSHAAAVVQIEVLARGRRALLLAGLPEMQRKNIFTTTT